ncbi:unnamed protein product [Paramecium primaurelia]|uniref:Uncharacterized protein n=1 Tax=Paramecium primaurelia TaxID=5886 RepID=A0A8S1JPJ2_PARPR|nr:unnamed protein product [Paramecium primaurelia]
MHECHLMPFIFTKYLQDDFDVPVMIQLSNDQKFFHKSQTIFKEYQRYGDEMLKTLQHVDSI